MRISTRFVLLMIAAFVIVILSTTTSASVPTVGICIRNCAQCKKMYGDYFSGPRCADDCVKFKGKTIPDCEDTDSIASYIHALEEN
ncbi:hypothetical protein HCN44_005065 [Aphidius gifuensis]|uniref:Eclosion hormone n=2 Tax=Aphidius gifuensis TaxID=684658 RepID=A0A834XV47_APHGI|nr:hypothetical protein HCN44_005065 [Aphidius gifuensis]